MPPLASAGRFLPKRHFRTHSQRREAYVGCCRMDQRQECDSRDAEPAPGRDETLCVNWTVAAVLQLADLRSARVSSIGSTGTRQERQHPLKGTSLDLHQYRPAADVGAPSTDQAGWHDRLAARASPARHTLRCESALPTNLEPQSESNSNQSKPPRMLKRVQHRTRTKRIPSEASTRSSTTMIGRRLRK